MHHTNYNRFNDFTGRPCRYGVYCSDVLCAFRHPYGKKKSACSDWCSCTNVHCKMAHAHKLRPPVCKYGSACCDDTCTRLHPPNNDIVKHTSIWRVFTCLPWALEQFMNVTDTYNLSLTCRDFNSVFSQNVKRLTKTYKQLLHKPYTFETNLWLRRVGIYSVTTLNNDAVIKAQPPLYYRVTSRSLVTIARPAFYYSLHNLLYNNSEPNENQVQWRLVSSTKRVVVLQCSHSVDTSWQTPQALNRLTCVDVCHWKSVWFTCVVLRVEGNTVHFQWPWWSVYEDTALPSKLSFPSPYIALPQSQAMNWKVYVGVRFRFIVRVSNEIYDARVAEETENTFMLELQNDNHTGFIEVNKDLSEDPDGSVQYAPVWAQYALLSTFNFKRLPYCPPTHSKASTVKLSMSCVCRPAFN